MTKQIVLYRFCRAVIIAVSISVWFYLSASSCLAISYDREAAYNYTQTYWNKACSDGWFWNIAGTAIYLGPGTPLSQDYLFNGLDCAHFVSCAIGNEPHHQGGGLNVPSGTGPYGNASTTLLTNWLLNEGIGELVSSVDALERGDVINYDWEGDGGWDHAAIYLGDYKAAAHTEWAHVQKVGIKCQPQELV